METFRINDIMAQGLPNQAAYKLSTSKLVLNCHWAISTKDQYNARSLCTQFSVGVTQVMCLLQGFSH